MNCFRPEAASLEERLAEVSESIENSGSYELTAEELEFGSRTAWRNASRCVGRIQWSNLKVKAINRLVRE